MNFNKEYSKNLYKNTTPTSAILSSYLFKTFSYQEKCDYLSSLKSGILSDDLINFCISNLDDADVIVGFFGLPLGFNAVQKKYTIEPFDNIESLIKDLESKFYIFNPDDNEDYQSSIDIYCNGLNAIQQLVAFDFYEFNLTSKFGKHVESYEFKDTQVLRINLLVALLENILSGKYCHISDFLYSTFFSSILYLDGKFIFSPRLIQYREIKLGKQYLDPAGRSTVNYACSDDRIAINHLLEILSKNNFTNGVSYKVLENAFFPQLDNAVDIFSKFIKRDKNLELKAASFLGNVSNYSAGLLVNEILKNYTPDVHNEWLSYHGWLDLGDRYSFHYVASILSNKNAIYDIGKYFCKNLRGKSDAHTLLILSAISNFSCLPPAISTHINNFVSRKKNGTSDLIRPFTIGFDSSDYDRNKKYFEEHGDDTKFLSNLFYGFDFGVKSLFFNEKFPSSKTELRKFLVFADGALKVTNDIIRLREDYSKYLSDNSRDASSKEDSKKVQSEFINFRMQSLYMTRVVDDIESKELIQFIEFNVKHGNHVDELDLIFRMLSSDSESFVNDVITLSSLFNTDFFDAYRHQILISKSKDEIRTSINKFSCDIKSINAIQIKGVDDDLKVLRENLSALKDEIHDGKKDNSKEISFIINELRTPKRNYFDILNFILLLVALVLIS